MDFKAIEELIKAVSDSKLTLLELESEGIKIKLEKRNEIVSVERIPETVKASAAELKPLAVEAVEAPKQSEIKEEIKKEGTFVVSPIVGTFYTSSGPNSKTFVQVGSKVKKGDVLCIIEAMKLMNEIQCEADGEIAEILVENEQMVEYGQPLFRIV